MTKNTFKIALVTLSLLIVMICVGGIAVAFFCPQFIKYTDKMNTVARVWCVGFNLIALFFLSRAIIKYVRYEKKSKLIERQREQELKDWDIT